MRKWILALVLPCCLNATGAFAQNFDSLQLKRGYLLIIGDSTLMVKGDTLIVLPASIKYRVKKSRLKKTDRFYDSLKAKSNKYWLTRQLYDALVLETNTHEDTLDFEKSEQWFTPYAGYVIRDIRYKYVDVLAGNVNDTLQTTHSKLIRQLNTIKSHTKRVVLRHNLIVKKGDKVDPGTLADNERIIRSLPFIEDARFYLKQIGKSKEVDLIVVTKDVFSFGFSPEISSSGRIPGSTTYSLRVFDNNFLGLGTKMSHEYRYETKGRPHNGYRGAFEFNNIGGSFINVRMEYVNIPFQDGWLIDAERQFLTPETKVAGGLHFESNNKDWILLYPDTTVFIPYSGNLKDIWFGFSPVNTFKIFSRNQLMISARYIDQQFSKHPEIRSDTNQMFSQKRTYLTSFTFRQLKYFKAQKLFGFGRVEDVAAGFSLRATAGYRVDELENKAYLGVRVAQATRYPFGYISLEGEFGGFLSAANASIEEGVLSGSVNYFTELFHIGKFSFRQLAGVKYVLGINMPYYRQIDIRRNITGINQIRFSGTAKTNVHLESEIFTPWQPAGFHVTLVGLADLGYVNVTRPLFSSLNKYSRIGFTFRLRNESLVFETINLSFNFFVRNPEMQNGPRLNLSLTNPKLFNPIDQGKPELVKFN